MNKIGVQLYTLRDLMKDAFVPTLEKVAKIGYEGVEFAGYGDMPIKALRDVVVDLGLTPVSSHVSLNELQNRLSGVIEEASVLQLEYVFCPYLPEELRRSKSDYQQLAEFFNRVGESFAEVDIRFGYHNHAFEFLTFDNTFALDYLYEHTQKEYVKAELDLYWIAYAHQDPSEYIRRYAGRCPVVHLKDMTADDERFFAEVGQGTLNWPGILSAAEESDVQWYIVEQDVCRNNPLESIQMSFEFLTQLRSQ